MALALNDLVSELTELATELYDFLLRTEREPQRPGWRTQIELYGKTVMHMRLMARNAGLAGIADACDVQHAHLHVVYLRDTLPTDAEWNALERWPLLMLSCLATPLTDSAVEELIDYCRRTHAEFSAMRERALRDALARNAPPSPRRATAKVVVLPTAAARRAEAVIQAAPARTEPVRYLLQHELIESIGEYFSYCTVHTYDRAASVNALRLCADRIQLLGISAAGSGLIGVMDCCLLCHDGLIRIANAGRGLDTVQAEELKAWSGLLARYLENPDDARVIDTLLAKQSGIEWFPRLLGTEVETLRDFLGSDTVSETPLAPTPPLRARPVAEVVALRAVQPHDPAEHTTPDPEATQPAPHAEPEPVVRHASTAADSTVVVEAERTPESGDDAPPRATVARREDVALTIPADANPKLVEVLLPELAQRASDFAARVARLAGAQGSVDDVGEAQRIAHTLKGAAGTVGIAGIMNLAHQIEDVLEHYALAGRVPQTGVLAAVQAAADTLDAMCDALNGGGAKPDNAQGVLQDLLDVANQIEREGLPAPLETPAIPAEAAVMAPAPEEELPAVVNERGAANLRVASGAIDELLRLAGEGIIVSGQLREQLAVALRQARATREQHARTRQFTDDLERLLDTLAEPGVAHGESSERSDELRTLARRLSESLTDARDLARSVEDRLGIAAELQAVQARLQRDTREAVLRARRVPVATLLPRLQRIVRQTCRMTGKDAELVVRGADAQIDADVLEHLTDPLMHLLRNAVDHGIETAARRAQLGKPPRGTVELAIARDGDHMVLAIRDDGAGLDIERIRTVATQRGLLHGTRVPGDDELVRMILLPGFTTRTVTTQTSGRGVGLDAVHAGIARLKGSLDIRTQADAGCTVELRVPLTLVSVHCLLVRVAGQTIAVSSRGVERILYSGGGTLRTEGSRRVFETEDGVLDAFEIEELMQLATERDAQLRVARPVLMLRDATNRRVAVRVEHVIASQELVVKPTGPYLPRLAGVEGATILGNGTVVPVVDLNGLILHRRNAEATPGTRAVVAESPGPAKPLALIVDDSPSACRALAEFVTDLGMEIRTAGDGLDALEVMKQRIPDLVLVDLEMPRMNGLELTEHMRASQKLRHVPVVMITSRSTQRHRVLAREAGVDEYLVKPFSEDRLADLIRERVARTPEAVGE